ncbi:phage tail protein [Pelagibacterium nitratireducens]|uniref:Phage tail protein n=1 Tax=Pelagibacterium nitratireducens TaxID=1046114 RepID=A0ABZ2HXT4_9HYPH
MLYQIGPITLDTMPFNADTMRRASGAAVAEKGVMGARPPLEFMGKGEDRITLSGRLLPTRIGGLTELETVRGLMEAGTRVPVMRGDGKMFGWHAIVRIEEDHANLDRFGVGFTLAYTIELLRDGAEPSLGGATGIFDMMLGLFEAL